MENLCWALEEVNSYEEQLEQWSRGGNEQIVCVHAYVCVCVCVKEWTW